MAGLTTAMLLADDGHQVVVVERDPAPAPAPAEAWDDWTRRGVNQFRLLHFLQPRFRLEAERALPRVVSALEAAGALRLNVMGGAPDQLTGGPRAGDDDFAAVTARRPVAEAVLAACAEETPGVSVRRGVAVAGVTTGAEALAGVPHVTGVRTEAGEEIAADLVVDATGRRSPLPDWVAGGRRATTGRGDRGQRLRLLRAPLPFGRRLLSGHHRGAAAELRECVGAHPPGRQRDVGGGDHRQHRRSRPCGVCSTWTAWTAVVRQPALRRPLARG